MSIDKDFELVKDFDKKFCLGVFAPENVAFTKGKGVYLYSMEGKKYLDMIGGIAVNSLGHNHKALTKTIQDQAEKFIHCSNYYYIAERSELAFRLCHLSFGDKVFFCNSGAEANEAAIKIARGYFFYRGQDRYEIITMNKSFHGRTMATIAATGQEKFRRAFEPNLSGFKYVDFNDYDQLEAAIGPNTAAVMLELIQGESGVNPANEEYVKKVASLCHSKGILLIVDEVQTGIGRTGTTFAYEQYGIKPDIMSLAKGLGGGVPIGAMVCTNEIATGFKPGDHGSTFGGNPLACAAGNTVLEEIQENNLLVNVNKSSSYLFDRLASLAIKHKDTIKQVRGKGLLIGIEFNEPISAPEMKHKLLDKGVLVSAIGTSTIRIAPPLIISTKECQEFIDKLDEILSEGKDKGFWDFLKK